MHVCCEPDRSCEWIVILMSIVGVVRLKEQEVTHLNTPGMIVPNLG
jgi:hypothetical protein